MLAYCFYFRPFYYFKIGPVHSFIIPGSAEHQAVILIAPRMREGIYLIIP